MTITATRHDVRGPALLTAIGAAGVFALIAHVALATSRGQRWDDWALSTVFAGEDARLTLLSVLGTVSIGAVIVVAATCVVLALVRGQVHLAMAALVVIAGSNVTTQLLKHVVLSRPDFGYSTLNSLPSGHTTVVASAAAALILVAPRSWRLVVGGLGSAAVTLTGASTIVAGWHRPADVVAALAVCLAWAAGAAAIVSGTRRSTAGSAVGACVGAALALVFLVAVGVRPMFGWDGVLQGGGVLGIVAAATAVYVWLVVTISPSQ